ncbi:MAG: hypothetical protein GXP08_10565 [Gammaproteobacteria bacterium]|nr:hypothetical protein [Gammaproteobacteria bacterium]
MVNLKPEFIIGSKGWHFDDWVGGFYPLDMPQEWWFSYYSNQFHAVLLPFDYITHYELYDWQSWFDDAPQGFTFYVELISGTDWMRAKKYLSLLGDQLGGLVLSIEEPTLTASLQTLVRNAASLAPLSVNWQKPGVNTCGVENLLERLQLNGCWRGELASCGLWCYSPQLVVIRDDSSCNSPAELRSLLEKCIKCAPSQGTVALFFNGSSPKIESMKNATVIGQLL